MRRMLLPAVIVVLLLTTFGFAKEKIVSRTTLTDNSVESLLVGVESDNTGLKTSAASILGDYKESKAVIPLMRELKSNSDERARIQAAVSLQKIGDARGIYSIKQAIKFDSSERVQRICKLLYWETVKSSKTGF